MFNVENNSIYKLTYSIEGFEYHKEKVNKYDLYVYRNIGNENKVFIYCYGKDIDRIKSQLKQEYIRNLKSNIRFLNGLIKDAENREDC